MSAVVGDGTTQIEIGLLITLIWNTLVFVAAGWMAFSRFYSKVDKRLTVMETKYEETWSRIHDNGFASKEEVGKHDEEIHVLRSQIAHIGTRVAVTESVCARIHGNTFREPREE